MTLFICTSAAVICTIVWYASRAARACGIGTLSLMYWGASLMWLVDAVAEYLEQESAFFEPSAAELRNDAFLGVSVVVLGLVIWCVYLLIKDPKHVLAECLVKHGKK